MSSWHDKKMGDIFDTDEPAYAFSDESEDANHRLDWLSEFPAVARSNDPDVRAAVENLDRRQKIIDAKQRAVDKAKKEAE